MATLLHIDSALARENSVSRAVTASFREAWEAVHPDGTVIHRDLAAEPVPHIDADVYGAGFVPAEERTAEQQSAAALRDQLIRELEEADAILIGAPLYNYAIPSTLKAWLDHVILPGRTSGTENPSAAGTPVTVVSSRGGSYAAGTPQEGNDFAVPYLTHALGTVLGLKPEFIVPELTLARVVPAMSGLIEAADASAASAHEAASHLGRELGGKLAGAAA
ncbi:FMN-dependent NADH-azoreductase [Streptomyces spiramenti]|uniref:FMN dependent NADH:quinone oxidoreductase n=1 Tax=Streptomyces spiramenti TaxID=2720606 RepID=A0ABX1AH45_9ACTN|nr:NAD(P)H-dependent oxidoreductase [Streptomyces spiramenti]NJP66502.1 FMN-dependent NADH-azoreductase [Streptomyces spiramenti]